MFRFVITTLQLHIVTAAFPWQKLHNAETSTDAVAATLLRGSHAAGAATASSKISQGQSMYAKECVDCFYQGAQCGCQPAMEYLACLTKNCYASNQEKFATMCAVLQSHCFSELNIDCQGPNTVCEGKFHQKAAGGLGLTWDSDTTGDEAFCGPFGNCLGEMHMSVNIHNNPHAAPSLSGESPTLPVPPPMDAKPPCKYAKDAVALKAQKHNDTTLPAKEPAALKAQKHNDTTLPAKGAVALKAQKHNDTTLPCEDREDLKAQRVLKPARISSLWLECGLPNQVDADIDNKEDWTTCISEVDGDSASCKLPMLSKIGAQQVVESYCVLTDGAGGKRLTQPLRRTIRNTAPHVSGAATPVHPSAAETPAKHPSYGTSVKTTVPDAATPVHAPPVQNAPVQNTKDTIEEGGETWDNKASGRPPYMKNSDSPEKIPPPQEGIIRDLEKLEKKSWENTKESSQRANERARSGGDALAREARGLMNATDEMARSSAERASEATSETRRGSKEAAERARQAGRTSAEAARRANAKAKQRPPWARDTEEKPPMWMRDMNSVVQTPFKDMANLVHTLPVKDIADSVVQSPFIKQFA